MSHKQISEDFLRKVQEYVEGFFLSHLKGKYPYHSLEHTQKVVKAVRLIGENSEVSEDNLNEILVAAWFHDVGYHIGPKYHETESVRLLNQFFEGRGFSLEQLDRITECIMATKMPSNPTSPQQKIMSDADLFHLSTEDYFLDCEKLKKEHEASMGEVITEKDWLEKNIEFFKSHKYFTEFGRNVLELGKSKNLKAIKKSLRSVQKMENEEKESENKNKKVFAEDSPKKKMKADRGRETMFRITSRNHLELSNMADNKANIMISVNAIMLSLIISVLLRKLEGDPYLIVPTLILIGVCLTTIIFAIKATRPTISSGKFTREDIKQKRTNLLFFGNFHQVSLEDFEWGMQEMIKDGDYLYSSMIKDIYYLGVILGKKYRNLRVAYTVFMYGFAIAILSYILAFLFSGIMNVF
jgi:predicted metal-dependent HD superfamily phosphohydrolase